MGGEITDPFPNFNGEITYPFPNFNGATVKLSILSHLVCPTTDFL